ncbi:hypothetical protein [uncultured Methanolobus sp.]|uniref:hypothetical protein n=1 Tax=uncultured Methanolobus sp. TaxID=218300 RepID=UPI002AAB4350|nr:hypothetical protein [uncultured Methanolobus sp.]
MDDNSRFEGVLISGKDITDIKIAEKALLLDESRLEALVELNQHSHSNRGYSRFFTGKSS